MNKVIEFDKERMQVGAKGGGKHWTKREIEAREQASQSLKTKLKLDIPDDIKNEPELIRIWNQTLKKAEKLKTIDGVDSDTLAVYCKAVYHERMTSKKIIDDDYSDAPLIAANQRYVKLVYEGANILGFSAEARARLAKKLGDKDGKTKKEIDREKRKKKMFGA